MQKPVLDEFTEEVKKIEEKAESILEDARKKKEQAIADAKTDSLKMISQAEQRLEKKKEQRIQKAKEKFDLEKQEIINEGLKEVKLMESKGRKNIDKAADFMISKLQEKIEAL